MKTQWKASKFLEKLLKNIFYKGQLMAEKFVIENVTAFVTLEENGSEGVMGYQDNDGVWFPLIAGDEERVRSYFSVAEKIRQVTGMKYKVLQFSNRIDVTDETIKKYTK